MSDTPEPVALAHDLIGSGPPIVLLHGITEDRRTWEPLLARLADRATVLAVDLRGHGASPVEAPFDLASMAGDVHALVARHGLGTPLVIGHSMGAMVATAYAAALPTRGVINVDQSLDLVGFQSQVGAVEEQLRDPDAFPLVIAGLFDAMRGAVTDADWERISAIRAPRQEVVLGIWSPVLDLSTDELNVMVDGVLGSVDVPYLALHGIDPGDGYAAWLQARIAGAELRVWPGTGHYPHLVDPDRFLEVVAGFDRTA
ncbi:MAG: alpha/beta fold hydrolase [Nitriliruptoraceae bacterium]